MTLIDITLTTNVIILILIALIVIVGLIATVIGKYKDTSHKFEVDYTKIEGDLREKTILIDKIRGDSQGFAQELAAKHLEDWKIKEMQGVKFIGN